MASLTGQLVAETYKALLKTIDNDILTASEKQITDGFGGGSNVFIDSQGFLRANKYKVTNGLATQFLKADGSLDSNTYLTGITSSQIISALGYTPVTNARTLTINGTTYDLSANRSWTIDGTSAVWGNISGTLSNQTDLQNALNAKYNNPTGTISQYIRGDGSLATFPTLPGGLPTGGTAGQILAKIDATDYNTHWIDNYATQTKNEVKLGATLSKGTPVYVSSANGTNMIVSAASNTTEATSSKTFGLLETGGVTNDLVKCVTFGLLAGLDTSTASAGDPVWLGPNGTLLYGVANKPVAPAHMVYIGVVTRVQQNNGEIFVNVQNGFEIEELHDVLIQSKANNQGLFYESSTGLWKNKSIATVLGYTPQAQLNGTGFVKASGTTITYDNSTYLTTTDAASTYQRLDKMVSNLLASATEYPNSNAVINALALKADALNPVFTGYMTISGAEPKLYFTDTDQNPDYFIGADAGFFRIYDQTAGATRFVINSSGVTTIAGDLIVGTIAKSGGTATQFLKADGSIDSSTYVTSASLANYLLISTAASTYQRLDKMVSNLLASDTEYPNSNAVLAKLALKADAANPVFTGDMTISGIAPKLYFTDTDNNPDYTLFVDSGYFYIYDQTAGATKFQITPSGNAINTGTLTSASFIKSGGTSSQYLMADGSVSTLSGLVTGTGTANRMVKFTGASTVGNSLLYDDGSSIGLGGYASGWAAGTEGVFQTKNASVYGYSNYEAGLVANAYYNLGWYRIASPSASMIILNSNITLRVAGTGSAGSAINWIDAFNITNSGNAEFVNKVTARGATTSAGVDPSFIGTKEFMSVGNSSGFFWENRSGGVTSNSNWYGWYTISGVVNLWNGAGNIFSIGGTTGNADFIGTVNALRYQAVSSSASLVGFGVGTGLGMFNAGTATLGFATASLERVRITDAGRVEQLYNGYVIKTGYSDTVGAGSFYGLTNSTQDDWQLLQINTAKGLDFWTLASGGSWDVKMTLTQGGNLGIGINAPLAPLHIQKPSQSYGQFRITSTSNSGGEASINYGRTDQTLEQRWTVGQGVQAIADSFGFYTGGGVKFQIDTNGTTTIRRGTSDDALKIYGSGASTYLFFKSTATYATLGSYTSGTGYVPIYVEASNLLLGTTVDNGSKLQVSGSGSFTNGITVNKDGNASSQAGSIALWTVQNGSTSNIKFNSTSASGWGGISNITGYATYFSMDTANRGWVWRYITNSGTFEGTNVAGIQNNDGQFSTGANQVGRTGYAQINVCKGLGAATTYREIDMRGNWAAGEGHAITAIHGSSDTNIVGQIVFQHDSPGSRLRFGRFYHGGDTNTYTMELVSTSTSSANLTVLGSVTATAFFESSDIRLKTLIDGSVQVAGIENLEAKLYEKNGKIELGYFAQDAEKYMPYSVSKNTDGFLTLSYREIHTAKISRLEKRVAELEKQLNLN